MTTPLKRKAVDVASSTGKKAKGNASITSFFSSPTAPTKPTAQVAPASSSPVGPKSTTSPSSSTTVQDDGAPSKSQSSVSATAPATTTTTPAASIFDKAKESVTVPGASASAPAIKFDKAKWVEKLSAEQKDLLALEIEYLHESWLGPLKDEITSSSFLELKRFLKREHQAGKQIFPPAPDVYSWSRHTPLNTVKAVILGQDPYHNVNQAHGLCFSVRPPTPAPPSLANIYKLLQKEYPETFHPPPKKGGLLTPWADRGVLLLNTCLTVRAHEANSHSKKGWEKFTQKCIDIVARQRTRGVVFLAWGSPAQQRVAKVDKQRHCILASVHPSPLSAMKGFFDCGHFRKTNEWLKERYGDEGVIDWNLDVKPEVAGV